jgi:hypothetical protein
MTMITMSRRELARLHALIDLAEGRISVDEAALMALLALGRRRRRRVGGRRAGSRPLPGRRHRDYEAS